VIAEREIDAELVRRKGRARALCHDDNPVLAKHAFRSALVARRFTPAAA
jgi:hypothetical protein